MRSAATSATFLPSAASIHWNSTWPLAFWVPLPVTDWTYAIATTSLPSSCTGIGWVSAVIVVVSASAGGTVHGWPWAAMFRPVMPNLPAISAVWPTMPDVRLYSLSLALRGTPNADTAANPLGGSKEATGGADGVAGAEDSPPPDFASDFLSSPPQPASRTTAAVTAAVATIGRSIVGYSPQVSTENDRLNASSVRGSRSQLSTGVAPTCRRQL